MLEKAKKRFIFVPACVYSGDVYIKKQESLPTFHKIVLRYIARNNNLIEVMNAFGLNPRIINDVIVDLLYKNLIVLDLDENHIDVTDEVTKHIQNQTLDEFFHEKHPTIIHAEWIQERITGSILSGDVGRAFFSQDETIDQSEVIDLRDRGIDRFQSVENHSPAMLAKTIKFFLKSKPNSFSSGLTQLFPARPGSDWPAWGR